MHVWMVWLVGGWVGACLAGLVGRRVGRCMFGWLVGRRVGRCMFGWLVGRGWVGACLADWFLRSLSSCSSFSFRFLLKMH